VAFSRDDFEAAERYWRQALEIRERLTPDSLALALNLSELGRATLNRGDLEAAEGYHRRALEVRRRLAPDGPLVAVSLVFLGIVAYKRGDLQGAEAYQLGALAIYERLTPGSLNVAGTLNTSVTSPTTAATSTRRNGTGARRWRSRSASPRAASTSR
jgi:tetratricopeptide (TPR) repeat protein